MTLSKTVIDEFKRNSKKDMTISDLQQLLDVKESIAEHTFGECSIGHIYACMASKMLSQILEYLDCFEIDNVTYEGMSEEISELYERYDEEIPWANP